jgi:hypothetical protein
MQVYDPSLFRHIPPDPQTEPVEHSSMSIRNISRKGIRREEE